MRKIAAVFSHPDDEILGCGGSLAKHIAGGDQVKILILATGLTSRGLAERDAIDALRSEGREAASALGGAEIEFADFPDNSMDSVPLIKVVKRVEEFFDNFAADVVYTHFANDLNIDHQVTASAVLTAKRPLPGTGAQEILACEVNSSTEWSAPSSNGFVPNIFQSIDGFVESKVQAMACYKGELREWSHPRSLEGIRALARWRGCSCGFESAEAFQLVRLVRS